MNYQIIYPKRHTMRELTQPRIVDDKLVYESIGKEEVSYEVSICVDGLQEMAARAADNKSQIANSGPLRVRVLSRNPVQ